MELLQIIGWALSVVTALFLGKGAIEKLIGTKEMVGNFAYMKLDKYRIVTGLGELLGVVLLLIPATSLFGAILIERSICNAPITYGWSENLHSNYDWSGGSLGTFSKSILIKTLTQKVGVFITHIFININLSKI